YIDAEVAKQLDYPIFMAVSEKGGKNNSGDYEYLIDEDGNLMEDDYGNPEINQDLVNHNITREMLRELQHDEKGYLIAAEDSAKYITKQHQPCIAEAFVQFAKEQGFDFWK